MNRIIALACVAGLAACGDDAENFKKVQDLNLSKPLEFKTFEISTPSTEGDTASNGFTPTNMPSADTHYCVLSRVSGHFQGTGEFVQLTIENGKWKLKAGALTPGGVSAQATCVPKYSFAMAEDKKASLVAGLMSDAAQMSSSCDVSTALAADAAGKAFFLAGMTGRWDGGGEAISVSPSGADSAALRAKSCAGGTGGWALRYVLRPDKKPVRYFSPAGATTDANAATFSDFKAEDAVGWWEIFPALETKGTASSTGIALAPVNQAVCGIVAISGKFRGSGEWLSVLPKGDNWVLEIGSLQGEETGGGYVHAAARCVLRDQRS